MPAEVLPGNREEPRVGTRRVVGLSLGFVAAALLLSGGLMIYYRAATGPQKLEATLQHFPDPQLQPNPAADYERWHRAQVLDLQGYRWADKSRGLVHVPIERAMAVVAARGAAALEPVEGTPPFMTGTGAPLDGSPRAVPQLSSAPYGNVR